MKMTAWTLFRRAAGMENSGAFGWRKTGQFQLLERGRRHNGNLSPMPDNSRRKASHLADFPVGDVVFELKRKEFKGKFVKLIILRLPRRIPH